MFEDVQKSITKFLKVVLIEKFCDRFFKNAKPHMRDTSK